jgi:hypothetical protein
VSGSGSHAAGAGARVGELNKFIKGGTHWPSNLRPCCKPCNSVKQSQLLPKSVVLAREIILEQRGLLTPKLIGLK